MISEPLTAATLLASVRWNEAGLVATIAQDDATGDVLMLAWMNREALEKTLETQDMWYWSRSRNALWRKGETSGHTQRLRAFYLDCDGDTLLARVTQTGPACHTGARRACFFRRLSDEGISERSFERP